MRGCFYHAFSMLSSSFLCQKWISKLLDILGYILFFSGCHIFQKLNWPVPQGRTASPLQSQKAPKASNLQGQVSLKLSTWKTRPRQHCRDGQIKTKPPGNKPFSPFLPCPCTHGACFHCSSLSNTANFSSSWFTTNSSGWQTAPVVCALSQPQDWLRAAIPLQVSHRLCLSPRLLAWQPRVESPLPHSTAHPSAQGHDGAGRFCLPLATWLKAPEQNAVPHHKCSPDIPHTYKSVISALWPFVNQPIPKSSRGSRRSPLSLLWCH